MKGDPTAWILARSSGLAAYLCLLVAVFVGTTVRSRPLGRVAKPAVATDLHRFVALMGLVAVALHGGALVLDSTVKITPLDLVVPGRMAYRPLWTGAGVVAAELMLVVYLSFALKRWIGRRAWRLLHWTTYPLFVLATAHGIGSGSDSGRTWVVDLYLGAVILVVFAVSFRALTALGARRPDRSANRQASAEAG